MMHSLNSNVDVDGKRYHVQTEKLGWQVVTLVFEGGAVIARRKKDLSEVGAVSMSPVEFATFMKEQHQSVINEIRSHAKTSPSNNTTSIPITDSHANDDAVVGPSVLPEPPIGTKKEVTNNSDDLISKFLEEWAGD